MMSQYEIKIVPINYHKRTEGNWIRAQADLKGSTLWVEALAAFRDYIPDGYEMVQYQLVGDKK
jgi:hypothetical protein